MTAPCPVEGCANKCKVRGRYCATHYWRLRKYGDLNYQRPAPLDRFRGHYAVTDGGRWQWASAKDAAGYGLFQIGQRTFRAHRWGYEQLVGAIPDGLVLDHLCRNTSCVNPKHLEPVTSRTNTIERGMGQAAVLHRARTCIRGHAVAGDNVYSPPSNPTWRQCKQCRRIRATHRKVSE